MNLQIETVTTASGKMDVIRDVETVRRVVTAAEHLAARLRLWSASDKELLCDGDAEALKEWDALSSNDKFTYDCPSTDSRIT